MQLRKSYKVKSLGSQNKIKQSLNKDNILFINPMKTIEYKPTNSYQTTVLHSFQEPLSYSLSKKCSIGQNSQVLSPIIDFEPNEYPFSNHYAKNPKILRAQLLVDKDVVKVKNRLSKIKHPNIICVEVAREGSKTTPNGRKQLFLDLTYQQVPFSIKFISFASQNSLFLFQKITECNFRDILNKVTILLMKLNINRLIRLTDIGVTSEGSLKIYVPPVCLLSNQQIPQHSIFTNNYKLVSWWQTSFGKPTQSLRFLRAESPKNRQVNKQISNLKLSCKQMQKSQTQNSLFSNFYGSKINSSIEVGDSYNNVGYKIDPIQPLKLYFKTKDTQRESINQIIKRQLQTSNAGLKNSMKSYQTEISKKGNIQAQKMKRIGKEVKIIKERMENTRINKCKESQELIQKKLQIIHEVIPPAKIVQKIEHNKSTQRKQQPVFRDSIQQNINCINIYHSPSSNPRQIYNKMHPSFHKNLYYPDPLDCISDQDSLDTYDIQFGSEEPLISFHQMIVAPLKKYEREISQRNYNSNKQQLAQSFLTNKINKKNQVQSRKFQTQSAGPLQFKNFVNNFIKPQYLAKRSNIYEDPIEEDSQHDQPQIPETKQRAKAQRIAVSKIHQSQNDPNNQHKKTSQSEQAQPLQFLGVNSNNNLVNIPKTENRQSKEINNESQDKQLIRRVQNVLNKTKKALAVLNKMKQEKGLVRKALSP